MSRKSTEGNILTLCNGAISWKSKKQTVTALSTCEAEYISICSATKEAIWLTQVISSLVDDSNKQPIMINIDNDGSIDLAKKVSVSQRTKHIDIRYHFIRDALADKKVILQHIPTSDQLADSLTKSMPYPSHKRHCLMMNLTFNK